FRLRVGSRRRSRAGPIDDRRRPRGEGVPSRPGRMNRVRRVVTAALGAVVLCITPLAAGHEVYYRLTVLGYGKGGEGRPVPDAKIEVVRDKTGFTYLGETADDGFYVVRVRLGDESLGEALSVRQGTHVLHVITAFDPTNQVDERGTRVDFEGARSIERATAFRSTLQSVTSAVSQH